MYDGHCDSTSNMHHGLQNLSRPVKQSLTCVVVSPLWLCCIATISVNSHKKLLLLLQSQQMYIVQYNSILYSISVTCVQMFLWMLDLELSHSNMHCYTTLQYWGWVCPACWVRALACKLAQRRIAVMQLSENKMYHCSLVCMCWHAFAGLQNVVHKYILLFYLVNYPFLAPVPLVLVLV